MGKELETLLESVRELKGSDGYLRFENNVDIIYQGVFLCAVYGLKECCGTVEASTSRGDFLLSDNDSVIIGPLQQAVGLLLRNANMVAS